MALNDRHKLLWSQPSLPLTLPPLPPSISRTFIPTAHGPLELLIAQPSSSTSPRKKALLFQHGGFGFAREWVDFMLYFSSRGFPCYAVSLRGHGQSWKPGYWRMVWGYGKSDFAEDLGAAVGFVSGIETGLRAGDGGFEREDLVLLGHSAGGGLSQYFLGRGLGQVGALCILAGFPCFGGYGVYWRWFKMDPWFVPRYYIRDLWHSRSPLSSTTLIHNAFFSSSCPRSTVASFEPEMCEYESMLWPLGMMFPFVNTTNVLRNILGWKKDDGKQKRLLVVAGEEDALMGVTLMRQMAVVYRGVVEKVLSALFGRGKGWWKRF